MGPGLGEFLSGLVNHVRSTYLDRNGIAVYRTMSCRIKLPMPHIHNFSFFACQLQSKYEPLELRHLKVYQSTWGWRCPSENFETLGVLRYILGPSEACTFYAVSLYCHWIFSVLVGTLKVEILEKSMYSHVLSQGESWTHEQNLDVHSEYEYHQVCIAVRLTYWVSKNDWNRI